MFRYFKLLVWLILIVIVSACHRTTKNNKLLIDFSADSSIVQISGMNEKSLAYLKNGLVSTQIDEAFKDLVSVVQTPNNDDTVGREVVWKGTLEMSGDTLFFKPENKFVKGQTYLVQTVIGSEFGSGVDLITSDVGDHVKPQEKLLKR